MKVKLSSAPPWCITVNVSLHFASFYQLFSYIREEIFDFFEKDSLDSCDLNADGIAAAEEKGVLWLEEDFKSII